MLLAFEDTVACRISTLGDHFIGDFLNGICAAPIFKVINIIVLFSEEHTEKKINAQKKTLTKIIRRIRIWRKF